MVFSALKGQKVMNFIGMFACVAVFVVGITAVVVGIRDASSVYQGGIFAIQKDAQMTMTQLITIAVGSCVCGCCSWAPDLMRFSKDYKTTTGVMVIGLGICGPSCCSSASWACWCTVSMTSYILMNRACCQWRSSAYLQISGPPHCGNAYSSSLNLRPSSPRSSAKAAGDLWRHRHRHRSVRLIQVLGRMAQLPGNCLMAGVVIAEVLN